MQMLGGGMILCGCLGLGMWYVVSRAVFDEVTYDQGTDLSSGSVDQ